MRRVCLVVESVPILFQCRPSDELSANEDVGSHLSKANRSNTGHNSVFLYL
jgi:hypothetical protein